MFQISNLQLDSTLLLRIFAILSIAGGLLAYFGIWKKWYWQSQKNTVYGYPILGILFILVSFEEKIRATYIQKYWIMIAIYVVFMALVVWISYTPPAFIKPWFVKRIEQEPEHVYQIMAKQVREGAAWKEKVSSLENLEKWIKEIKRLKS